MNAEVDLSKDVYVNVLLNPHKPKTRLTLFLPLVNSFEIHGEVSRKGQALSPCSLSIGSHVDTANKKHICNSFKEPGTH